MSLKKQFAVTLASVGLGAALIGGGTFAYFSDKEEVKNTFAAGTLDLAVNPSVVFNLKDMKPGDWADGSYNLTNNGTVGIKSVYMTTTYNVTDSKNDNAGADLGEHLLVEWVWNDNNNDIVVLSETLAELKKKQGTNRPDLLKAFYERKGHPLDPKEVNNIDVRVKFVDNKQDQNVFQGDSVSMTWQLDAVQADGKEIK